MKSVTYALVVMFATAACSSGQTGSPDCAVTLSCVCATVASRSLWRAEVVALDDAAGLVTLRVIEVLYPYPGDDSLGRTFALTFDLGLPCEASSQTIAVGTEVAALVDLQGTPQAAIARWGTRLQLSDTVTLSPDALSEMLNRQNCPTLFPAPQKPCHDTEEIGPCTLSPGRAGAGSSALVLLALQGLLWARRPRVRADPRA